MVLKFLKLIFVLFFIAFFLVLSSGTIKALEGETILTCGGDDELIVGCLGDNELIFLGNKVPTESGGQQGDGEIYDAEQEVIEPDVIEEPPSFMMRFDNFLKDKGLSELNIPILKIVIIIGLLCFFWWLFFKRRKKEEEIETKEN